MNMLPRGAGRRRRSTILTCAIVATLSIPLVGVLSAVASGETVRFACERGAFCLWDQPDYTGHLQAIDLRTGNPGDCIPLPAGFVARSLANRSDRDLTVYADKSCAANTPYQVYPGGGTFVPRAMFAITAVKIGD